MLVHLDLPTTVRPIEQRQGRICRIDSRHDEVEVWWPHESGALAVRRRDMLPRRLLDVQMLIGGNVAVPKHLLDSDLERDDEVPVERNIGRDLAAISTESITGYVDPFWHVRSLVETDSRLVESVVVERMRNSRARVDSHVSSVVTKAPWAFFCLAGSETSVPRWVFFEGDGRVETDLAHISTRLRSLLTSGVQSRKFDINAENLLLAYTARLHANQDMLLSPRRRRALEMARRVFEAWIGSAEAAGEVGRALELVKMQSMLTPGEIEDPQADLASVADVWLQCLHPFRRDYLNSHPHLVGLCRLEDLVDPLIEAPLDVLRLKEAFSRLEKKESITQGIAVAILGVPGPFEPYCDPRKKVRRT